MGAVFLSVKSNVHELEWKSAQSFVRSFPHFKKRSKNWRRWRTDLFQHMQQTTYFYELSQKAQNGNANPARNRKSRFPIFYHATKKKALPQCFSWRPRKWTPPNLKSMIRSLGIQSFFLTSDMQKKSCVFRGSLLLMECEAYMPKLLHEVSKKIFF